MKSPGGEDKTVLLNTDDLESLTDTVPAQERSVAPPVWGKLGQVSDGKGVFRPEGRPTFVPTPRTVVANCPVLAGGVFSLDPSWPDLVTAAGYLAARWSLHPRIWETLCVHLGREWATLTLATVAELPDTHFTLSRAPTSELRRAGYVAGIAKKLAKGQDASVAASWFRHFNAQKAHSMSSKD